VGTNLVCIWDNQGKVNTNQILDLVSGCGYNF
jgi:hypothetical protein